MKWSLQFEAEFVEQNRISQIKRNYAITYNLYPLYTHMNENMLNNSK